MLPGHTLSKSTAYAPSSALAATPAVGSARLRVAGAHPHALGMSTESTPIISRILPDGTIIETIFDVDAGTTALVIGAPNRTPEMASHFDLQGGRLVPYSATNNLLTSGCVLLPSGIGELEDKGDLIAAIRKYLAGYVDLSPAFMDIAPYYVLLTWVYDSFNELPYLRFRGDWGTGKTRSLLAVGSICYKPFFASGASTVSPIFHILDGFRGTLVLDEADFRYSDMTGELVKILNQGTVNGLPVLRTMTNRQRELNPQAFRVFGPKIIAMRESFADRALESRFITEDAARRPLPPHSPIHTPESLRVEARELRNRLLAWRLANRASIAPDPSRALLGAEPRLNQTALALLSLIDDEETRSRIASFLMGDDDRRKAERLQTEEALVLRALADTFALATEPSIRIADVATRFNALTSERSHIPISNKAVGHIVREKLGIPTAKFHGVYGIRQEERERVRELADRFGVPHTLPISARAFPQPLAEAADSHVGTKEA